MSNHPMKLIDRYTEKTNRGWDKNRSLIVFYRGKKAYKSARCRPNEAAERERTSAQTGHRLFARRNVRALLMCVTGIAGRYVHQSFIHVRFFFCQLRIHSHSHAQRQCLLMPTSLRATHTHAHIAVLINKRVYHSTIYGADHYQRAYSKRNNQIERNPPYSIAYARNIM